MSGRLVSVVIGSYNRKAFLKRTIESLRRELEGLEAEILVVDGGSTDGSLAWLVGQKDVVTIVQHNRGTWRGAPVVRRSWGYFMNLGFRAASGRFVCMMSDDCLVVPGAIANGLRKAEDLISRGRRIGAVAFFWRNWPEERRYRVGLTFGGRYFVNHGLYLGEALRDVGYADEHSFAFYHADSDLCLRMSEAGYECVPSEGSFIEHYDHANLRLRASNSVSERQDRERLLSRWSKLDEDWDADTAERWVYLDHDDPHRTARGFGGILEVRVARSRATLRRIRAELRRARRRLRRGLNASSR